MWDGVNSEAWWQMLLLSHPWGLHSSPHPWHNILPTCSAQHLYWGSGIWAICILILSCSVAHLQQCYSSKVCHLGAQFSTHRPSFLMCLRDLEKVELPFLCIYLGDFFFLKFSFQTSSLIRVNPSILFTVFIPVVGIHSQRLLYTVCHLCLGFLPCIWYSFCLRVVQKSKQYLCASGSFLVSLFEMTITQELAKSGRH